MSKYFDTKPGSLEEIPVSAAQLKACNRYLQKGER